MLDRNSLFTTPSTPMEAWPSACSLLFMAREDENEFDVSHGNMVAIIYDAQDKMIDFQQGSRICSDYIGISLD